MDGHAIAPPRSMTTPRGAGQGPDLIKRIERIGFRFRNFENYRTRALPYAGKPNWRVLGPIVVR